MGYLGAIIGAGFASGQEIVQFFVVYGNYGLKGAVLSGAFFAIFGMMLFYIAHLKGISNYQAMLAYILGSKLGMIADFMLAIFLFLGTSTMLAASGAVFYEHLYLSKNLGIFLACFLVIFFLIMGRKGLFMSYNILVPVKILLLLAISGYAAFGIEARPVEAYTAFMFPQNMKFWFLSSLLYVAYNFALALVVLTEYQTVTSFHTGILGAGLGGIVLGVLIIFTYDALGRFLPSVMFYEVPMLYVSGNISRTVKYVYTAVLWVGILTTAIANVYGFAQRFAHFSGISYQICLVLCIALALPLSLQSFSSLVGVVYPLFGLLGMVILFALAYKTIKDIAEQIYYNIRK
ncbi:MAG: hypothetical protein H0Z36_08930 [Thermosyntropha sp.]|nr:hypothetical protein [Thermosyntropha sp.]